MLRTALRDSISSQLEDGPRSKYPLSPHANTYVLSEEQAEPT